MKKARVKSAESASKSSDSSHEMAISQADDPTGMHDVEHESPRPIEATIRFGDSLFVNADCIAAAERWLEPNSVDLIITDPPYGINGDKLHKHYNRDERFVVDGYVEIPASEYNAFSRNWIAQAERALRPGGQIYIVSGYTNLYDILDGLRQTSLREINHIIWKYNFGVFTRAKYVSSHYHILYYEKPGGKRTFNLQSRFSTGEESENGGSSNYRDREDVWIINREYKPGQEKNKNELPHQLLLKILQYSSNEGDLVCDFFMGGCSTAATAIGLGRRFVGFEVSQSIFTSRVAPLRSIRPGQLLETLPTPSAEFVPNRGKPWSPREVEQLIRQYAKLLRDGSSKRDALRTLSSKFGRGSWSLVKLLKQRDADVSRALHSQNLASQLDLL